MNAKSVFKALLSILFLGAGIYAAVQMYQIFYHQYKTETAISWTMADSVTCDGVVVFEEQRIEGGGSIGYLIQDGERVSAGTQVAESYSQPEQAVYREQLTELEGRIALLEKSRNASGNDLNMLTTQMQTALYDLLEKIDRGNYSEIEAGEQDYLLAANRMKVSTGQTIDFDGALSELEAERELALGQLGSPEAIRSPGNGYFVSSQSAHYLNYSSQTMAEATPSGLKSILQNEPEASSAGLVGKIVTSYHWNFYGLCSAADAARFEGITSVSISFPGKAEETLPATVKAVEIDEEAGVAKLTLSCEYIGADILSLGHTEAKIDLKVWTGLRVPVKAMHIVNEFIKTGEDSNGDPIGFERDTKGVYVKFGSMAKFKRIRVLTQNENYMLVPADNGVEKDAPVDEVRNEVRLYDEIIVEGTGLYDGKLL